MQNENPAISVVIPVYNAEKYIGELLKVLQIQTFKDFEIIAVDDCSTDGSAAIIENYVKNGGGQIKLIHTNTNSGGPSVPRNMGLEVARGKYIFFSDSDDYFVKTALAEMYTYAEQTQADVVYCEKWGESSWNNAQEIMTNLKIAGNNSLQSPAFFTENLETKLQEWIKLRIQVMPWLKLVRRELLLENEIKFPEIIQEDSIWSFEVFMAAKKFLLVPNVYYIHRNHAESLASYSWKNTASVENIRRKLDRTFHGLEEFDNWLGKREFFRQRPDLRYAAVNNFMNIDMNWALGDYANLQPHVIYDALKNYFGKYFNENESLIMYLGTKCLTLTKENFLLKQKLTAPPQNLPPQNRKERRKKK